MEGSRRQQRPRPQGDQPDPWRVEGRRTPAGGQGGGDDGKRRGWRPPGGAIFWIIVILALAANWIIGSQVSKPEPRLDVPYTLFRAQVQDGNVKQVTSQGDHIQGQFDTSVTFDQKTATRFETIRPSFAEGDGLLQLLIDKNVTVNAKPLDEGAPFWESLLIGFGPTILLVLLFVFLMRRAAGSMGGGLGGLGRSRAKRYDASAQRTTFQDVAGIDEAEEELVEIVDFLRNPDRYRRLGGAIPKGVLLSGPPGTGKTLLARAVAGEADVPFFSLSASEFVEMVVGVGASRVRDLFNQAKAAAPAIIFIDELDAIGRSRGGAGGSIGGHDEREQTLNQILTEMDGFSGSEGVIVLAATNRPEVLDSALLRPGRFDRRVTVNPPDQQGRRLILDVHTRGVPLGDDVDLDRIASTTPGMVGADLKNLVNEAALTAARRDHERVLTQDFTDALEKIVLGTERRITLSAEERERTAFHESGHALLGMLQPGADPVRKVSIIPRGRALGVTFQSPTTDRYGYDAPYLRGRIIGALGGRAAEELVYDGRVTTGAESDLEQVTAIARQMVGRWGMSDAIGLVSVLPQAGEQQFGFGADAPSESTRRLVDDEVRRIVDECYDAALTQLRDHREQLDALAAALLEKETLDQDEAYRVAGFPKGQAPADDARVERDGRPAPVEQPAEQPGD